LTAEDQAQRATLGAMARYYIYYVSNQPAPGLGW